MGKLTEAYNGKQQQINEELERQKAKAEREKQERLHHEIREREREMWEEKFKAELKISGVASAIDGLHTGVATGGCRGVRHPPIILSAKKLVKQ